MKSVNLNNKFSNKFINEFILNLFIKLTYADLWRNKNSNIFNHIKKEYNLSIDDIIYALKNKNSLTFTSIDKNNFILGLNSNIYIKNNIKLNTIVKLIDYGNLAYRGLNIFNKSIDYISKNWTKLHFIYLLKGGSL